MSSREGTNENLGYFFRLTRRRRTGLGLCIMLRSMAARSARKSKADFRPYLKSKSKLLAPFNSFIASGISSWWRCTGLSSCRSSVLHMTSKYSLTLAPSSVLFKCSETIEARKRWGCFYTQESTRAYVLAILTRYWISNNKPLFITCLYRQPIRTRGFDGSCHLVYSWYNGTR